MNPTAPIMALLRDGKPRALEPEPTLSITPPVFRLNPRRNVRKIVLSNACMKLFRLLFASVLVKLGSDWWSDENYSHGLLMPFISGYAIWLSRHYLFSASRQPRRWLGSGLMLTAVAYWP